MSVSMVAVQEKSTKGKISKSPITCPLNSMIVNDCRRPKNPRAYNMSDRKECIKFYSFPLPLFSEENVRARL
jgi:hypothetical protein